MEIKNNEKKKKKVKDCVTQKNKWMTTNLVTYLDTVNRWCGPDCIWFYFFILFFFIFYYYWNCIFSFAQATNPDFS